MRFYVAGPARARALAKHLDKITGRAGIPVTLTACQAAVANALGYASFSEFLKVSSAKNPLSPPDEDATTAERADRLATQSSAFVKCFGLDPTSASNLAGIASLTGRPGKSSRGDDRAAFVTTHHLPVRIEGELAKLSPEALRSLDTIIEGLPPGGSTTGETTEIEHPVTAQARLGRDPHIAVRYAKPSELAALFASGEDDEDMEAENLEEAYAACHPSMRREA